MLCSSVIVLCAACTGEPTPTSTVAAAPTMLEESASIPISGPVAGGALVEENELLLEEDNALSTEALPAQEEDILFPQPSIPLPTIDPLEVEGNISVGGSTTVHPITRRMYRRFVREGYAGVMKIERMGTGEGFRLLCSVGTADIVNAGREVQASEIELCESINRLPVPFAIGRSAVTLFVHPDNRFLSSVSLDQVRSIFTATLWSDVNPTWPEIPIERLLPRLDSDEIDAFAQLVLNGDRAALLQVPSTTTFDTNDELVQALTENRYAIGFANHTMLLQESEEFIRALPIDGQLPDEATVSAGNYPLVYSLYLYTDGGILRAKPQVAAFLNFYLNHINEEIRQIGYFPADAVDLDAARARLIGITSRE